MYQITHMSSEMSKHIIKGVVCEPTLKYPFHALDLGYSFSIPIGSVNEKSLRVLASQEGRRRGMKFKVMKHNDFGLIEVGRIL